MQKDCFEVYALVPGLLREEVMDILVIVLGPILSIINMLTEVLPLHYSCYRINIWSGLGIWVHVSVRIEMCSIFWSVDTHKRLAKSLGSGRNDSAQKLKLMGCGLAMYNYILSKLNTLLTWVFGSCRKAACLEMQNR